MKTSITAGGTATGERDIVRHGDFRFIKGTASVARHQENEMRKVLLASVALLTGASSLAYAQAPANPLQGQLAAPYGAGGNTSNNNNAWGIANTPTGSAAAGPLSTIRAPNTYAVPTPGTLVIHMNGRVEADVGANF